MWTFVLCIKKGENSHTGPLKYIRICKINPKSPKAWRHFTVDQVFCLSESNKRLNQSSPIFLWQLTWPPGKVLSQRWNMWIFIFFWKCIRDSLNMSNMSRITMKSIHQSREPYSFNVQSSIFKINIGSTYWR